VTFEDNVEYYKTDCENAELEWAFSAGSQKMSIIAQNVDGLHRKAGSNSKYITELHGTHDRLVCMTCGGDRCRHDFHNELDEQNSAWIQGQLSEMNTMNSEDRSQQLRPDGDAFVQREDYDDIEIPACSECDDVNDNDNGDGSAPVPGFYKPDVVFFGDSVPKHRVNKCYGAVDAADGLLCIGSSLAVHSAYRFVQRAAANKIPIAILNVGETRAEVNNLDVLKIEAPAGPTLGRLVEAFESEQKKRVRVD
jgi:NAD-dependent deacetylase sirtuin 4